MIGFFVNQLALRTRWSEELSFRDLLVRIRETVLGAYEHQDVPFEKLVEELQPERNLSRHPLFQVKLVLQNVPELQQGTGEVEGLSFEPLQGSGTETIKVDLHWMMWRAADGLRGRLSYSQDLYCEATAERLLGHVKRLLEEIAVRVEGEVGAFELLTEGERKQLLVEWQGPEKFYGEPRCVHELIALNALRSPEAVAVQWDDGQCSYEELNGRANQLARYLRGLGVRPEMRVGLYGDRCLELIVGMLGILKAGAAYVPLDGGCPKDRLRWMMEELEIGVLVTQAKYRDGIPGYWVQVICVDNDWEEIAKENSGELEELAGPENLAYAIYTSGSTGKAKAVGIEHRQLLHYVRAMGERLKLKECASFGLVSTLAADLGYTMVYPALTSGRRLHLAPEWETGRMESYLERTQVECLKITPAHLRAMMGRDGKVGILPSRRLVLGGEASESEWVEGMRDLGKGCEIWNHYGPTECTVGVTAYQVLSAGEGGVQGRRIPMGRGVANTQVYVLDRGMKLVPVGVAGELYIGGQGVGRGYLKRPELTGEKFVPNPFTEHEGERLYRTGDRVRWTADGNLEYLGRVDEQVKIRGYRIEPGEVAAMLREHRGVREAAVVVQEELTGEKRLVGYVAKKAGEEELKVGELLSHLQERLPAYMVPARLVMLEQIPLLANGKIDRRALPAAELESEAERYVAPRNDVEEILCGIWEQVLGVTRVGVEDNFFDLGGHSLLATQVIARVVSVFGVEIPLPVLFEAPTVARFAEQLEQHESGLEELLQEVESLSVEAIETQLGIKSKNENQ